jgi:hypothetical protein
MLIGFDELKTAWSFCRGIIALRSYNLDELKTALLPHHRPH